MPFEKARSFRSQIDDMKKPPDSLESGGFIHEIRSGSALGSEGTKNGKQVIDIDIVVTIDIA